MELEAGREGREFKGNKVKKQIKVQRHGAFVFFPKKYRHKRFRLTFDPVRGIRFILWSIYSPNPWVYDFVILFSSHQCSRLVIDTRWRSPFPFFWKTGQNTQILIKTNNNWDKSSHNSSLSTEFIQPCNKKLTIPPRIQQKPFQLQLLMFTFTYNYLFFFSSFSSPPLHLLPP